MSGTLGFTVQRTSSYFRALPDGGPDITRGAVFLADQPIGCPPGRGPIFADARLLALDATSAADAGARRYTVLELPAYAVMLARTFADGGSSVYAEGNTGDFTFTSMSLAAGISGNFNLTMRSTDGGFSSLYGSFTSPYCGIY